MKIIAIFAYLFLVSSAFAGSVQSIRSDENRTVFNQRDGSSKIIIEEGIYTPIFDNIFGIITAIDTPQFYYIRQGKTVTVFGSAIADASGAGESCFDISIPFPTTIDTNQTVVSGSTGLSGGGVKPAGFVTGNSSTNKARGCIQLTQAETNRTMPFNFTYRIID